VILVLASASPRRRELLADAGVAHRVRPAEIDETFPPGLTPEEVVLLLAERKARRIGTLESDGLVLGADTIVVLEDRILGKPSSLADARATLLQLSGRTHQVMTGVFLLEPATGKHRGMVVVSRVTFREIHAAEIEAYLDSGEPLDKAGSYGIQGGGGAFVKHLDGSFENVVGLPVREVRELLEEWS